MQITVRLFALLRELKGQSELTLEVPEGCTVGGAWDILFPELDPAKKFSRAMLYAVNQEYVTPKTVLCPGDELVFVPPVSGGCA